MSLSMAVSRPGAHADAAGNRRRVAGRVTIAVASCTNHISFKLLSRRLLCVAELRVVRARRRPRPLRLVPRLHLGSAPVWLSVHHAREAAQGLSPISPCVPCLAQRHGSTRSRRRRRSSPRRCHSSCALTSIRPRATKNTVPGRLLVERSIRSRSRCLGPWSLGRRGKWPTIRSCAGPVSNWSKRRPISAASSSANLPLTRSTVHRFGVTCPPQPLAEPRNLRS